MTNIMLSHNEYQTSLSVDEIISEATANINVELELAISLTFDICDEVPEDFDGEDYHFYFHKVAEEITNRLGQPCFNGTWKSDEYQQWREKVCPSAFSDFLVVWPTLPKNVYLRFSQVDKEGEIVIALGVEKCECSRNLDWDYEADN